jgi:D-alanyl-D-alanine carboxypeptidase (penicillin-binding protein 5/6)
MTLLLIFEALDNKKISLTDQVSVSEHAASMGGSQVFLEPNETQTVDTMIKCISIASANDAATAMAELISGSETEFVVAMNQRAEELGMKNTHFMNCSGLDDDINSGHYSSAYDVALMSRELITKHPDISKYSTVWMDTFVHTTKKGEKEFGLTNTNKLIRTYNGITGLKTGSTSKAKYCLSATAKRNGMDLIAVVMACPSPKDRFAEAAKLLDYGFAHCRLYEDNHETLKLDPIIIAKGVADSIIAKPTDKFSYVFFEGVKDEDIKKEVIIKEEITAPIKEGDQVGEIRYILNDKTIGNVPIISTQSVEKAKYKDYLGKIVNKYFMND